MNNTVYLPRKITQQLLHLAQTSPDREICGLVGAKNGIPAHCYPVDNIATQPDIRFQLDPKQQITALKTMRERGESLFAIYHSHPNAPAIPSATDLAQASYPDAIYLIISLNTQGVLELRAYHLEQGDYNELNLSMTP